MRRELTGRHVLFILLAVFGTIFAVNGVFAYFAVSRFPGLETEDAYRRGVAFNEQIARSDSMKALDWTMQVRRDGNSQFVLRFQDTDARPVAVTSVSATLFHPTDSKGDRPLTIDQMTQGTVTASLDEAARGQWQLRVTAEGPMGRAITFRRSLWLD